MYLLIDEMGNKWLETTIPDFETDDRKLDDLRDLGVVECFLLEVKHNDPANVLNTTVIVHDVLDETSVDIKRNRVEKMMGRAEENEASYDESIDDEPYPVSDPNDELN